MARRSFILLIVCSLGRAYGRRRVFAGPHRRTAIDLSSPTARAARGSRPEADSELRKLGEGACDAYHLRAEVNRHRARLDPDDPTDPVGVVRDQLAELELFDDRL